LLLFVHAGWQFDGFLAAGDNKALGLRGNDWECPILSHLPRIATPPALASLPALGGNCNSAAALPNQQQQVELDGTASAAAAAAAAAAILEPSASQQLLPLQPKHKRGIAGSSSMSSFASTGSLLGVVHYPGAGFAAGCDSETISSSSVSDCSPVSEVSSSSGSAFARQSSSQYTVSGAVLSSSDVGAALEGVLGSDAAIQRTVSNSSIAVANAGADMCSTAVTGPAAVLATDGAVVPLTEPVLAAAAASEAAAAAVVAAGSFSALTQQQPPSTLYAWLEQTPEPNQAAAAAAVADSESVCLPGGCMGAGVVRVDYVSSSTCNSKTSSSGRQQQLVDLAAVSYDSMQAESADAVSHSSSSSSSRDWFFCISPEACNFPITWWLGSYDGQQFDVAAADGPHRLDLGTTLYAATLWQDPKVCVDFTIWLWAGGCCVSPVCGASAGDWVVSVMSAGVLAALRCHMLRGVFFDDPQHKLDSGTTLNAATLWRLLGWMDGCRSTDARNCSQLAVLSLAPYVMCPPHLLRCCVQGRQLLYGWMQGYQILLC
jgi:sucrose-6-phosphate hydrolase SacC (GH32 family)